MTNWEIFDLKQHQPPDLRLAGCFLDKPPVGVVEGNPLLEIVGWALQREQSAVAVELICNGKAIVRQPMNERRPDLAVGFPGMGDAELGGFRTAVGLLGLADQEILVQAVLRDQGQAPVASFRLRRAGPDKHPDGPLVSVVIPCFRHAHFLRSALESVLMQTYAKVEVVVVDDGSPDNTAAVAGQFPGVIYVRQENAGLSAARNAGLRRSTGSLLIFLDADDRLLPEAVAAGLGCFQKHPDSAFVSGRFRFIGADGAVVSVPAKRVVGKNRYKEMLRLNYISMHATVMYRRHILEEIGGFDAGLRSCEDYDVYLRICRDYRVECHDQVVAEYRRHGDNMSGNAARMIRFALAALKGQRWAARANPEYNLPYEQGKKGWQSYYGQQLFAEIEADLEGNDLHKAGRTMLALLRHHPRAL